MEADQATWWETFSKLQRICRKAAQVLFIAKKLDREQMHNYFMSGTQPELLRPIPWNSVESDLGYTSRIYFDNVTLASQITMSTQ